MRIHTLLAISLATVLQLPITSVQAQEHVSVSSGSAAIGYEVPLQRSRSLYWTPERMRNAVPLNVIQPGEPTIAITDLQARSLQDVQPFAVDGEAPLLEDDDVARVLYQPATRRTKDAADTAEESITREGNQERPLPFTGTEIFDSYEQYPLRTVGKVFFTQNGSNFVCSAAAVVSDNKRLVYTAGHCVAAGDGLTWSGNVFFVPAYREGNAPMGVWSACGIYTTSGWFENGDFSEDFGIIKVCDQDDGTRLHDVVGSLGLLTHASRVQHWNDFGYPAAPPFNGETLNTCQASHGIDDTNAFPATIGIGCDMTGGSSGGPWILGFKRLGTNGNYLNGLNSYGYSNVPNVMFSPYFGDMAQALWQYAIDNGS